MGPWIRNIGSVVRGMICARKFHHSSSHFPRSATQNDWTMEPFACNDWVQEWSKNFGTHASSHAFTGSLLLKLLPKPNGVMSSHTKLLKSESQLQWLLSSLVYHLNPSGTNSKVEMMKKIQMYPWSTLLLHSLGACKLDALDANTQKWKWLKP